MRHCSTSGGLSPSPRMWHWASKRAGFTLIELLVVMAIIGILVALLLPAVQSIRESASRAQCANNLKNLALACQNHDSQHRQLPTGGWGWWWVGDPDRGVNHKQPGGWGFNILPFIEQNNLYQLGHGLPPAQKKLATTQLIGTPLRLFNCPSRRPCQAWPNGCLFSYYNSGLSMVMGRMDYAANSGDGPDDQYSSGPDSLATGDDRAYPWLPTLSLTGVIFQRSELALTDIPHGASHTYLLGEKYLNPDNYRNGLDGADNENQYVGFDNDVNRCTYLPPMRDRPGYGDGMSFGSAHPVGVNMAYCDGSVHFIPYTVDPQVHRQAGNRYEPGTLHP